MQVGHVLRHDPGFWTVRSMIHNPELKEKMGKLFNIHFLSDQEKPYTGSGFHPSIWRKDRKQAHAGTLYEHSIHDFDMIHYWFGHQYRFSQVAAHCKNFFGIDGIEDSVGVLLDLESISGGLGATFVLTAVWHNLHRDERHIEIFWENAHLAVKYAFLRMSGFLEIEGEEVIELNQEQMDQRYRESIGYGNTPPHWLQGYGYESLLFIDSLISGKQHSQVATLEDSQRAHHIVNACYLSSQEHQFVRV